MSAHGKTSDADRALVLAYLDGALEDAAVHAFELRLAREPGLVAELDELSKTDALLRQALRPGRLALRRVLTWAATAALALGIGLWLSSGSPEPVRFRLALVETAPSDVGLHEVLGLDPDWLPLGMGYRSTSEEPAPTAELYAETLGAAFDAHVAQALASEDTPRRLSSFVLALKPEHDAYALVVCADDGGRTEEVFPGSDTSPLLRAGALRLLPRAPVVLPEDWESTQRVDYDPGVLTRRGVAVLVALCAEDLEAGVLTDWEAHLASASAERTPGPGSARETLTSLQVWLEQRGFTTQLFSVEAD